jgi:tRNA(His) guanylyltransferase
MKFSELDSKMRVFETSSDHCVLPGIWMIARLDGRSFTKLTKETLKAPTGESLKNPFDDYFKQLMSETTKFLTESMPVVYSHTHSDEISLLFSLDTDFFNRKTRKLNSILAGEASAFFSLKANQHASFDCRICELPSNQTVVDYFRWRQEDAARNALSSYCYWTLRKKLSVKKATNFIKGLSTSEKNEMLFDLGINFNEIPNWQKRGIGFYWSETTKTGFNPVTQKNVQTIRSVLTIDEDLPMKDKYASFIVKLLNEETTLGYNTQSNQLEEF